MTRRHRSHPPAPAGTGPPSTPVPGLRIRAEHLVIGLTLADGAVVLTLDGRLDRPARATLLRVAGRAVRTCRGTVVVDCAALVAVDEPGIDALSCLRRLPGVDAVRLRHVAPDLGRRLDDAGLAAALGLAGPAGAFSV